MRVCGPRSSGSSKHASSPPACRRATAGGCPGAPQPQPALAAAACAAATQRPAPFALDRTTRSHRSRYVGMLAGAATAVLEAEPIVQAPPADFPIPRGETAGATIVLDTITVQAGDRDLLSDVSWRLLPGQRAGLVGSNGCGKSTLLRCLCGLRPIDAGTATVAPLVDVGYLEQTAVGGSTRTVWQEARSRMTGLVQAELAMKQAELEMEQGDASAAARFDAAREAWEVAGGPESERTITTVLQGLGFRQSDFQKRASEFSGGWQMRIALARLLLGPAGQGGAGYGSLLLLDEPTNHLDSAACKWLADYLRRGLPPQTSVVLVSHDEALLEQACDRIVEVRGRKLHHYVGGFKKFLTQRSEREAQARAEAENQQAEIEKLEAFIARFGAKASKASQAQSKMKLLEKLKAEQVEIPAAAATVGGGDARKVSLKLPRAPACHTEVIKLNKAVVGWGKAPTAEEVAAAKAAGKPVPEPLLRGIDLTIKRGQRVLVLGPNGAGKSTLLKAISGNLALWDGTRALGDNVKLGIFNQDLAQDLPLDRPALDYVEEVARRHDPSVTMEKCRQALGALGLTGNVALQRIGVLSGGEKARVALAAFALVPANVLLLDEASNHLDVQTIQVLTGALRDFDGAIIAITHNQAFATSLNATHVLRVENSGARLSDNMGLSAADFDHRPPPAAAAVPSGAAGGKKAGAAAAAAPAPAAAAGKKKGTPAATAALPAASTAPVAPPAAASTAPAAALQPKPKAKRTILSYSEQLEYKKLAKEMEQLGAKRTDLEAKLAKAGAAGSGGYAEAEKLAMELGKVAEQLESKELRWLELAEIAGDI